MNDAFIRTKLVEVLQTIQAASALDCPPIAGTTKPIDALPKFDSKIWPVAIGMLAAELGITLGEGVYAAPLRLLAREAFDKLSKRN